jgi:PAS domain S-box-containing protein
MVGLTQQQCSDFGWGDVLHPDDSERTIAAWKECVRTGEMWDIEHRFRGVDGQWHPVLARGVPIRDEQGSTTAWAGINLDISRLKRAEEALLRSNQRFELLAETASRLLAAEQPQQVVEDLCRKVMNYLDCNTFFNFLADDTAGRLHLNACAGIPADEARKIEWLDYGVAVCGCAAAEGQRIVAEDIFTTPDSRTELVKSYGIQAYACHPLLSTGRVIGTLSFGTRNRTTFTPEELELMKTVADQVAIAMERKQAQEALSRARDKLELRVQERTAMLNKVNEMLREEIEDRKRIEIAVRESEERFRLLIHTAPVVIVSLAPDGTILEFNPEAELAYGRTRAEVLGRNYLDLFIPAKQHDMVTDAMERVLAGEPISSYENPIKSADGSELFYIWNIDRVVDEKGNPAAIIAVGHDVTERRKMLEELEAAAAYTRNLIEASLDPLVTINRDGKVTDMNRATEQILNLPREQIIGTDFSDYFTEPENAQKAYRGVFKRGFVRDFPLAVRDKNGNIREVLYNATVYRNRAGEIEGVFAAARDITKRKRAEARLRESEERLRILSARLLEVQEHERKSIATELHDSVASSLTAVILGLSRAKPAIDACEPRYRDILTSSITLLQNAIDEARQLMNSLRPPMLDDFGLISSIRWFKEQYEALNPQLTTDTEITIEESSIPEHLKIVLFRIIQEAFTNIAKHSRAQTTRIFLGQKENSIDLVISDDGSGFNQEAFNSTQKSNRGLGIMSMKERAELSGGKLIIESAAGKGTVVFASWPIQP